MSDSEDVGELGKQVDDFYQLIRAAVEQSSMMQGLPPDHLTRFLETWPSLKFDVRRLFQAFIEGEQYPHDRLPRFVAALFDVVLELQYLMILPGLQNEAVYQRGFDPRAPLVSPRLLLIKHTLDQAEIGAVRILWERVMGAIYWLEIGKELVSTNSRSKKKRFSTDILVKPKWSPLIPALETLAQHDDDYRTPEFHSSSVLRKEFLGERLLDPNDYSAALVPFMNGLFEVMEAALLGKEIRIKLGYRVKARGG